LFPYLFALLCLPFFCAYAVHFADDPSEESDEIHFGFSAIVFLILLLGGLAIEAGLFDFITSSAIGTTLHETLFNVRALIGPIGFAVLGANVYYKVLPRSRRTFIGAVVAPVGLLFFGLLGIWVLNSVVFVSVSVASAMEKDKARQLPPPTIQARSCSATEVAKNVAALYSYPHVGFIVHARLDERNDVRLLSPDERHELDTYRNAYKAEVAHEIDAALSDGRYVPPASRIPLRERLRGQALERKIWVRRLQLARIAEDLDDPILDQPQDSLDKRLEQLETKDHLKAVLRRSGGERRSLNAALRILEDPYADLVPVQQGSVELLSGTDFQPRRNTDLIADAIASLGASPVVRQNALLAARSFHADHLLLAYGHSLGGMVAATLPAEHVVTFGAPVMPVRGSGEGDSDLRTAFAFQADIVPKLWLPLNGVVPIQSALRLDFESAVSDAESVFFQNETTIANDMPGVTIAQSAAWPRTFSQVATIHNGYGSSRSLADYDALGEPNGKACIQFLIDAEPAVF
jgi:hypothetical protein